MQILYYINQKLKILLILSISIHTAQWYRFCNHLYRQLKMEDYCVPLAQIQESHVGQIFISVTTIMEQQGLKFMHFNK